MSVNSIGCVVTFRRLVKSGKPVRMPKGAIALLALLEFAIPARAQQQLDSVGALLGQSLATDYFALSQVEFSRDSQHLLAHGRWAVYTYSTKTGKDGVGLDTSVPYACVAYSPDATYLAVLHTNNLYSMSDASSANPPVLSWSFEGDSTKFNYSGDGKTLVGVYKPFRKFVNGYLRTWDVASGKPLRIYSGNTMLPADARITPDGKHLIALCGQEPDCEEGTAARGAKGEVDIWNLETGVLENQTAIPSGSEIADIGDDCKTAAFVQRADAGAVTAPAGNSTPYTLTCVDFSWDAPVNCVVKPPVAFKGQSPSVCVSSCGKIMACGALFQPDGSILYPVIDKSVRQADNGGFENAAISDDGKWLASAGKALVYGNTAVDSGILTTYACVFIWKLP